jgi:hypothetical protein
MLRLVGGQLTILVPRSTRRDVRRRVGGRLSRMALDVGINWRLENALVQQKPARGFAGIESDQLTNGKLGPCHWVLR